MIYWAPFLHFYQPPTQYKNILDRICKESYIPLVKVFKEHPEAKVTINLCGILTEMLNDYGYKDILNDIKGLAKKGQVEFVESAKFHAILPLIPKEEIKRQIELNKKTNSYFFRDAYQPKGFFLPEMCYSDTAGSVIKGMGYEWLIVSGISCPGKWPLDFIYSAKLKAGTIKIFFRDDIISNKISFKNIDAKGLISALKDLAGDKRDIYVITAMDAETFGHHIRNWEKMFLGEVYKMLKEAGLSKEVQAVKLSELFKIFPVAKSKPPKSSSWSTTKEEILAGNYYPLWNGPDNKIHSLQWDHMNICFKILKEAYDKRHNEKSRVFLDISRSILDKALHSCQFWWANKAKQWNENLINKGLILQEETIFNAYKAISSSECIESEKKRCYYQYVLVARDIAAKIRDEILV